MDFKAYFETFRNKYLIFVIATLLTIVTPLLLTTYMLGIYTNLYVEFPNSTVYPTEFESPEQWAFGPDGPSDLNSHASLGNISMYILAVIFLLSLMALNPFAILPPAIALTGAVVSVVHGGQFVDSNGTDDYSSYIMASGYLIIVFGLILTWSVVTVNLLRKIDGPFRFATVPKDSQK